MHASIRTLALAVLSLGFAEQTLAEATTYKHVAVFSIDGFHGSDVAKYIAVRPKSTIATLLETGYEYTDAFTSAPSDSFPGTQAQFTGAGPRTTGVWYDDTYDRTFFAPGSDCSGKPGAEVVYDETIDYNSTEVFSGGINPKNLPRAIINGVCTPVFPHSRIRVNTVFEVVASKGKVTAYTDKHPAYDMVRGPSGKGLTQGYFPEINAFPTTVNDTITYDQLHVDAFLDWLDGKDPKHAEGSLKGQIPTLFGGNFQAVSVAQKTVGYQNKPGLPFTAPLLRALDFVDASLGKVVAKLKAKGIYDETLIVVASKHGQSPIDPSKYKKIDPKAVTKATKVNVAFQTSDDIALIFLENHQDTLTAVRNLKAQRNNLEIQDLIYGRRLIELGFGNPLVDPAVPDIIVKPELGIIYTTSTAKIAEHGGISNDDRHVSVFVSNPKLEKRKYHNQVSTKQVGPTILKALGLNPMELKGAVAEGTKVLNGF
ncbi:type I phosphodiesterase/nucleotide pyrophosphatase [Sphaerosporella brunnea]|uniref:Type I phosphodiesterase/nucleotide pyrophosphatase n=1 Tax=Sphaerosporella brunnea TaxID=1250544 RepID=A0A5J5F4X3_9PEZI|nr:type I phosphodiesterase/nucleotide pyrophosphatase [Sphaerosporella brunnea]